MRSKPPRLWARPRPTRGVHPVAPPVLELVCLTPHSSSFAPRGITLPRFRCVGGGLALHCMIGTRRVTTHSPSFRQSRRVLAHASQLAADVLCEHETP